MEVTHQAFNGKLVGGSILGYDDRMNDHHPTFDEATRCDYVRRFILILKQYVGTEIEVRSESDRNISTDDLIELAEQAQAHPGFHIPTDQKTYW